MFLHSRSRFQFGFVAAGNCSGACRNGWCVVNAASRDKSIGIIRKYTVETAIVSLKCTCLRVALKGH